MLYFGWDISTAVIGLVVLDESRKMLHVDHLDISKHPDRSLNALSDVAHPFIRDRIQLFEGDQRHIIEDRLAGFSGGGSNAGTIMKLAAFNAIVSWMVHSFKPFITHIHPSTVKSLMRKEGLIIPKGADKKALTLEFVRNVLGDSFHVVLNKNGNPKPFNYDRADAYCVALSGILLDAEQKSRMEASSPKGSPRKRGSDQG